MDGQRDDIRQVPDPNSFNKQQFSKGQEIPSPQQIPGREAFLERPDVPAQPETPATQSYSTGWVHTRQGFIRPRKDFLRRFFGRFFPST